LLSLCNNNEEVILGFSIIYFDLYNLIRVHKVRIFCTCESFTKQDVLTVPGTVAINNPPAHHHPSRWMVIIILQQSSQRQQQCIPHKKSLKNAISIPMHHSSQPTAHSYSVGNAF
jgi:hypothetical protein